MGSYYSTICFTLFFFSTAVFNELNTQLMKKCFLLLTVILSFFQGFSTFQLAQTTNTIYQEEVNMLRTIKNELTSLNLVFTNQYKIAVYGGVDFSALSAKKGAMIRVSFFNYDPKFITGNSQRVADFLTSQGTKIDYVSDLQTYQSLHSLTKSIPSYPKKGFIKVFKNYLIINLGKQ